MENKLSEGDLLNVIRRVSNFYHLFQKSKKVFKSSLDSTKCKKKKKKSISVSIKFTHNQN